MRNSQTIFIDRSTQISVEQTDLGVYLQLLDESARDGISLHFGLADDTDALTQLRRLQAEINTLENELLLRLEKARRQGVREWVSSKAVDDGS